MFTMSQAPVPIKELRLIDASYYICGFSSEQRLDTTGKKFRGLELFLLPDTMWVLAKHPKHPDQLISPYYVKHLMLMGDFETFSELKAAETAPPPPKSPAMVAAEKKITAKKAEIEARKNK